MLIESKMSMMKGHEWIAVYILRALRVDFDTPAPRSLARRFARPCNLASLSSWNRRSGQRPKTLREERQSWRLAQRSSYVMQRPILS